jgi:hypothetical protein
MWAGLLVTAIESWVGKKVLAEWAAIIISDAGTDGLILPMTGIKIQIGGYSRGRF